MWRDETHIASNVGADTRRDACLTHFDGSEMWRTDCSRNPLEAPHLQLLTQR